MPKSTKQDILDTLLILLRDKTISDITVKDLTERCGISRQAFYYHFQDLYAVVDWGLRQDSGAAGEGKGSGGRPVSCGGADGSQPDGGAQFVPFF